MEQKQHNSGENKQTPKQHSGQKMSTNLLVSILVIILIVGFAILISTRSSNSKKTTPPVQKVALAPAQVSITKTGFDPSIVTVQVNQGVIWTNNDTATHEVNSDPYPTDNNLSSFNDQQPLLQTDTYDYIFNKPGTYTYHDDLHPYTYKGTIVVKD